MSPDIQPNFLGVARVVQRGDGLSVIICTRDRASSLGVTLDRLIDQLVGDDEVIVVDNGSSDNTPETVAAMQRGHHSIHYIYVANPGKSSARNAGIVAAKNPYVAFLDDDAVPAPDWRYRATTAFSDLPETCGALTGQIIPDVPGGKPSWMSERDFSSLSSRVMKGDRAFEIKGDGWLITANVVCRKSVLDEVGGFDPIFDVCGYGEDVQLARRISRRGYGLFYYPELKVRHTLPSSRFTREGLIKRRYNGAFGECLIAHSEIRKGRRPLFIGWQIVARSVYVALGHAALFIYKTSRSDQGLVRLRSRVARSRGFLDASLFLLKSR